MFSGGLLSRNLARRQGMGEANVPGNNDPRDQANARQKRRRARKDRKRSKLMNWCDSPNAQTESANKRSSYMLEVPGNIRLVSAGGAMIIVGTTLIAISVLLTWALESVFCWPMGIGIGIYTDLVAITWVLEERNSQTKLYHIQDIYTQYAVNGRADIHQQNTEECISEVPSDAKSSTSISQVRLEGAHQIDEFERHRAEEKDDFITVNQTPNKGLYSLLPEAVFPVT